MFDAAGAREKYSQICVQPPDFPNLGFEGFDLAKGEFARDMFAQMREQLASAPSAYEVPLMAAAASGNAACVDLLLQAGTPLHTIDNMRTTALFHAGSPEVVRTLVAAGIDISHTDDRGKDALQHVLEDMGVDDRDPALVAAICIAMVQSGLPLAIRSEERHRLYDAAFAENPHAVRWLLQAGHAIEPRGDGATALHAICWHWDHGDERDEATRDIVRTLLAAGVDPDARDTGGNTPLHEAVAGDGTNLVAAVELLNAGADVNAQNSDGQTPLVYFYESLFDYARVVPFLLEHGANPLIRNARGRHAIDIARQMIAGEDPDWRAEQWNGEGGPPCCWKAPAEPGDAEHQMLILMLAAAKRFHA
jgi:ankyrin repeat protein